MTVAAPPFVANVVLNARRRLRRAADRFLPPDIATFDLATGVGVTHALGAFARLGIADVLHERRMGADELAPRIGADADALHRLLRAAATAGIVEMDHAGTARLTRLGETLRSSHPRSQRDWCIYMSSPAVTEAWAGLTDAVRTGESAFHNVHGRTVWEYFADHPEEERTFTGAMQRMTAASAPAIAAAYPWPAGGSVCDVGGGAGALLAAILDTDASLRGILLDNCSVLAEGGRLLAARGHVARANLVVGDFFDRIEVKADVYVLKDVLHDWDDERSLKILECVRAAAPHGARIVLVETPQEPNAPHPFASIEDLQMLAQCEGGRQRSVAQLRSLLLRAGFTVGEVYETLTHALVEGVAVARPSAAALATQGTPAVADDGVDERHGGRLA
ncbi:methyltransferase [Paraconexibacter sp.]|uniref:methyltransferase n=1 Tax=Paraconexibacter sp. TaxID=2949640 RepID=UPI0035642028